MLFVKELGLLNNLVKSYAANILKLFTSYLFTVCVFQIGLHFSLNILKYSLFMLKWMSKSCARQYKGKCMSTCVCYSLLTLVTLLNQFGTNKVLALVKTALILLLFIFILQQSCVFYFILHSGRSFGVVFSLDLFCCYMAAFLRKKSVQYDSYTRCPKKTGTADFSTLRAKSVILVYIIK